MYVWCIHTTTVAGDSDLFWLPWMWLLTKTHNTLPPPCTVRLATACGFLSGDVGTTRRLGTNPCRDKELTYLCSYTGTANSYIKSTSKNLGIYSWSVLFNWSSAKEALKHCYLLININKNYSSQLRIKIITHIFAKYSTYTLQRQATRKQRLPNANVGFPIVPTTSCVHTHNSV